LNASNAYKSIIDAINRAWNASMDAVTAAEEAKAVSIHNITVLKNRSSKSACQRLDLLDLKR